MILLDAYALIALLIDEHAGPVVRGLLREGPAAITAVTLAETADVLQRRYGVASERVRDALSTLRADTVRVMAIDADTALLAADLRARHYHRTDRPLSLADCVLLAVPASGAEHRIATADRHVLAVARAEDLEAVELPGTPSP